MRRGLNEPDNGHEQLMAQVRETQRVFMARARANVNASPRAPTPRSFRPQGTMRLPTYAAPTPPSTPTPPMARTAKDCNNNNIPSQTTSNRGPLTPQQLLVARADGRIVPTNVPDGLCKFIKVLILFLFCELKVFYLLCSIVIKPNNHFIVFYEVVAISL